MRRVTFRPRVGRAERSLDAFRRCVDAAIHIDGNGATERRAPAMSILTPTWNPPLEWLADTAASVFSQSVPDWEWCVVDDGSPSAEVRNALDWLASRDPRVRIAFGAHGGISHATNAALGLATGEYVCFLDHDDTLAPSAVEESLATLEEGYDVVYSDEDKFEKMADGYRDPFHKPAWSPEYARGVMYVGHLLSARRQLVLSVGGLRSEYDGVQDYELVLRMSEVTARIGHIPRILYHWRKVSGSVARSPDAKPQIESRQQAAVNAQLGRLELNASAERGPGRHRVRIVPGRRQDFPLISVIVPTRDAPKLLVQCLSSIFERSTYPRFEVLVVDNDTTDRAALEHMTRFPVRRVLFPGTFNFSRANNVGSRYARGEFLVFLNNDTSVITPAWMENLLYYAEQPDVGMVGALLCYPNGLVQHAGVILGPRGTADHVMRGFGRDADGFAGSLVCAREVTAVTAACAMMKKRDLEAFGEFDERYGTHYQDVDLCLRLRRAGKRNIFTPRAVLYHHESMTRRDDYDWVDRMLFLDRWEDDVRRGDPYYNPNFDPGHCDYTVRGARRGPLDVVRILGWRLWGLARDPRQLQQTLQRARATFHSGGLAAVRRKLVPAVQERPGGAPADGPGGTRSAIARGGLAVGPGSSTPGIRWSVGVRNVVRNVLFVLYHNFRANSAVHVHNLANRLAAMGLDCAVAVPFDKASVSALGDALYQVLEFAELDRMPKLFSDGAGPDVVHAWTPREVVRTWCEKLASLYRFRLCVHLEDNEEHLLEAFVGRPIAALAADAHATIPDTLSHPVRYRRFLASADGVTVIVDRLQEFVPAGRPVMMLWPGVETASFHPRLPDPEARDRLRVPLNSLVLCYIGNVHPANAREVRSLYVAVALLNREGVPTVLIRTGRDDARFLGDDQSWVRRHVIPLGYVERGLIPALLGLADVLVQPGRADAFNDYRFPSKIPEYLAMGKPVVLPRTNIGRFLHDGVDALVLPVVDATSIVEAVKRLRNDPELARTVSAGAVCFAKAHLDWDANSAALKKFYEGLDTA